MIISVIYFLRNLVTASSQFEDSFDACKDAKKIRKNRMPYVVWWFHLG